MATTRCSISSATIVRSISAKMPIVQMIDPGCRPYERRWRDKCVDAGLDDAWLERLNALAVFDLISICEGHPDEPVFEHRRTPHINLRVKDVHAENVRGLWNNEPSPIADAVDKSFAAAPCNASFEVRSGREVRPGSATGLTLCLLKIKPATAQLETVPPAKTQWFEQTIIAIETLDRSFESRL